jgi:hypothetical protein
VLAILEADGGWMTLEQIEAEFELRWGYPPTRATLRRALYRVANANAISIRTEVYADYDTDRSTEGVYHYGSPLGFTITRHVAARLA